MSALASAANRDTELRLGPKGRRVFTVAGWNKVLRDAGIFAGNWWIANYGPLRFNAGYARANLGYVARSKRKVVDLYRGGSPFVDEGTLIANFNSRSRTEATATKGGARFWIVCPFGHIVRKETSDAFRKVPARESAAVSREYRRAVIVGLQEGRVAHAAKKQAHASARAAKKADNAKYRAAIRANRAVGKANTRAQLRADRASVRSAARQLRRQRTRKATIKLR